jgi:hypothetical protein
MAGKRKGRQKKGKAKERPKDEQSVGTKKERDSSFCGWNLFHPWPL